jgi:ABC-type polysaccharide/polyol phosphate transport system ATPase subunit
MTVVMKFDSVSKIYSLGYGQMSFREMILTNVKRVFRSSSLPVQNNLLALQNVSFEVHQGEVLGIIGSNGAGKTTTLKILSKVTRPTSGKVFTEGRVSSLIELGAGFHPDLTGRENIFLNGAIMGMDQKQIADRFDEIVSFAEIEAFLDTPVKRYSSGMYARLGFAVAAHVNPDILLVDEVLSVGDEAFQMKCRDFIRSYIEDGHTSIFVSHNLYAIEQLCDRVIWLDKGQIQQIGEPGMVLREYLDEIDRRLVVSIPNIETPTGNLIKVHGTEILDECGQATSALEQGKDMTVRISYEALGRIESPYFCVWISEAQSGLPLFSANMLLDNHTIPFIEGRGTLSCRFNKLPLMPKAYSIWLEVYGQDRAELIYKWNIIGGFRILDTIQEEQSENRRGEVRFSRAHGAVKIPYEWVPQNE